MWKPRDRRLSTPHARISLLAMASSPSFPIHPCQPPKRGPWHICSSPHAPGKSVKTPSSTRSNPGSPSPHKKIPRNRSFRSPPLQRASINPTPLSLPSASRALTRWTHPHGNSTLIEPSHAPLRARTGQSLGANAPCRVPRTHHLLIRAWDARSLPRSPAMGFFSEI